MIGTDEDCSSWLIAEFPERSFHHHFDSHLLGLQKGSESAAIRIIRMNIGSVNFDKSIDSVLNHEKSTF